MELLGLNILREFEIATKNLFFLSFGPASKVPKLTHYGVV